MNAPLCTLKDVDQAAEELMALGCKVGALHINDGAARLGFLGEIRAFAEEVYQDIKDGVISAAEGVEALWDEHEALRDKGKFYAINGITVAGGVVQVKLGTVITGASGGIAVTVGGLMISHGVNNIYEGLESIYNGPNKPSVVGPTRWLYQEIAGGVYAGNIAYGTTDLVLSAFGVLRLVRTPGSVQLFRRDPFNYEHAYNQAGRLALLLEGSVDAITLNSILNEEKSK